jgi:hypothetical protein
VQDPYSVRHKVFCSQTLLHQDYEPIYLITKTDQSRSHVLLLLFFLSFSRFCSDRIFSFKLCSPWCFLLFPLFCSDRTFSSSLFLFSWNRSTSTSSTWISIGSSLCQGRRRHRRIVHRFKFLNNLYLMVITYIVLSAEKLTGSLMFWSRMWCKTCQFT